MSEDMGEKAYGVKSETKPRVYWTANHGYSHFLEEKYLSVLFLRTVVRLQKIIPT